ncbi:MAG: tripartite tricarboxylate transporter substrate binding protein [Armatimonadota bacterium]|nr:tripartite tricarboxylate transporter substrate binding protein [Armatimonadota bacterium]MDR7452740.1 tripartite tricarboxylate transporter substrate binding protein [Armatimonadota bacterium]MDR7468282.1 tripartite tricarboxylate transporter substrate binding protein [Armatimonadota bacterium]MDR7495033.1 tripartite tricarboxylate transporter substrate binding protein [Armatimonadota bacterium]MDR7500469.1 tripartite tricarboxylate transporter substrate binding protein [Armatimonadota bact
MRRAWRVLPAMVLVAGLAAVGGAAPAFPDRPVEIIAPAGVGGGWDTLSRLTARTLAEEKLVTQPITVTNMPGGSGAVAIAHVVTRRKGDAYTLVAFSPALTLTIVNRNTPYSYKDVVPITALSTDYGVLVVRKDSAINNLRTLLEVLKRDPGAGVVAGGSAPGSMDHIIFAKAARAGGVDPLKVRYIPFQGGGEAMAALLGGSATVLSTGASEVIGQLQAGAVRVLAIFSEQRLGGAFRNVPTAAEQGYNVTFPIWRGFYGPPEMPASAVKFWEETLVKMTKTKSWEKVLNDTQWFSFVVSGDRFRRFLEEDTKSFETLLRDLGFVK